jgi:hypothetical protein
MASGVDSKRLLRRDFTDDEESIIQDYISRARKTRKNKLWVVDVPGTCSMSWIKVKLAGLPFKPHIVITDYAGDMVPSFAGAGRNGRMAQEAQAEIAIEHSNFAKESGVILLSAQQLNREGQARILRGMDPGNENIARSDMYPSRSSVVIVLAQDQAMESQDPPTCMARVTKGRIGGRGAQVLLECLYETGDFREAPEQTISNIDLTDNNEGNDVES